MPVAIDRTPMLLTAAVAMAWCAVIHIIRKRIREISDGYDEDWKGVSYTCASEEYDSNDEPISQTKRDLISSRILATSSILAVLAIFATDIRTQKVAISTAVVILAWHSCWNIIVPN